jgi:hypothetical protein
VEQNFLIEIFPTLSVWLDVTDEACFSPDLTLASHSRRTSKPCIASQDFESLARRSGDLI